MKLLSEDVLKEFGFLESPVPSQTNELKVMSKDAVDIVIRPDGIFYRNMGFFYPLKDLAALRKLYKELGREDLKPVKH
ncbi:MAG: hypothetical protein K0S53_516 [Bacteroidetes bacterium]|jgi:hypothetical protein|nr:hypothetical protein [Bacteroidota bacterium]MDF2451881.1 hypothetical protein [Bacteroidota bacterium]